MLSDLISASSLGGDLFTFVTRGPDPGPEREEAIIALFVGVLDSDTRVMMINHGSL